MSGECFVDTNILFYAHDKQSGMKHEKAKQITTELWLSARGVISTQVLQEFCVILQRKSSATVKEAGALIQDFLKWKVVVNTGESILRALEIGARHQVSFWDALILQAATTGGAEILYTEDLSDGQTYGSVRVVNPFK